MTYKKIKENERNSKQIKENKIWLEEHERNNVKRKWKTLKEAWKKMKGNNKNMKQMRDNDTT